MIEEEQKGLNGGNSPLKGGGTFESESSPPRRPAVEDAGTEASMNGCDYASDSSVGDDIKEINKQGRRKLNKIAKKPAQLKKSKAIDKKPDKKGLAQQKLNLKRGKKQSKLPPTQTPPAKKATPTKSKPPVKATPKQSKKFIEQHEETKSEQVAPSSEREQKYYMNFDFYFKRTSFRTMTVYFKHLYKPFFEGWKSQKRSQQTAIEVSLTDFIRHAFPGLLEKLPAKAQAEMTELVKLLVFTHRHNKNDPYLADPVIDFTTVREPMYKYSRQAQEKFFDYPVYSFLFAWFATSPHALHFAHGKYAENSDKRYMPRMEQEVAHLGQEALFHLNSLQAAEKASGVFGSLEGRH